MMAVVRGSSVPALRTHTEVGWERTWNWSATSPSSLAVRVAVRTRMCGALELSISCTMLRS